MTVTLSEAKNNLINNIAEGQGFEDYEIEVKSGSMKGDGYLGIINTIHIYDGKKELNLILKSAMSGENLRQRAPVRKAYEREIYLYTTIFPEFEKFAEENGIEHRFKEVAKCYGTLLQENEECLVLENLKEIDYKLWNRKEAMNEDHVGLVFTAYARFHGTSLALKILNEEKHEEFRKNLKNIFEKDEENEEDAKQLAESVKQVFGNGFRAVADNEKAVKALSNFAENCQVFFKEELKQLDKYSCVLHGDCWCNNMMFKYQDPSSPRKPTEMRLLDWQISQVGSPILDLSYFFYACASKAVLYDLEKFLRMYHDNLSQTVKEAGLNPDEVLTFEELKTQWKKYSKFGLFMTLFVMKIILSEVEEAPDLSALADAGKTILEWVNGPESQNTDQINKRISDIIVYMTENDYL